MNEKDKKKDKKITNEKPVSLAGASFEDVVDALLKTPKPEKEKKEDLGTKGHQ